MKIVTPDPGLIIWMSMTALVLILIGIKIGLFLFRKLKKN